MKVPVGKTNTYKGQKEEWTEQATGEFVLQAPTTFIHKSHSKINTFEVGVITCVYDAKTSSEIQSAPTKKEAVASMNIIKDFTPSKANGNAPEYVYRLTVPAGTFVLEYGGELRFIMGYEVTAELIGEMGSMRIKDDSYDSRVYGGKNINVFTKKY